MKLYASYNNEGCRVIRYPFFHPFLDEVTLEILRFYAFFHYFGMAKYRLIK